MDYFFVIYQYMYYFAALISMKKLFGNVNFQENEPKIKQKIW